MGIYFHQEHFAGEPQSDYRSGHGRSVHLCYIFAEDSFCYRKLFPYDGTGLGAILFGPASVSVLGIIVLLFQAILLAHGGLTTLGANTFPWPSPDRLSPLVSTSCVRR